MDTNDVSPAGMCLQVEQAITTLAPCIKMQNLNRESRRQLLLTLDLLTSIWSDLQKDENLLAHRAGALRMLATLCEMVPACEQEEVPLALQATYRVVEGWHLAPEVTALPAEFQPSDGKQAAPAEELPEVRAEAQQAADQSDVPQETAEDVATELPSDAPEVVEPAPQPEVSELEPPVQTRETRSDEAQRRFSARLEALERQLDHVENHILLPGEAIARVMASACLLRLVQSEAETLGRVWDATQIRGRLLSLLKVAFPNLWVPPLAPNIDFSEHELECLQIGYEALAKSWQMWDWYQ